LIISPLLEVKGQALRQFLGFARHDVGRLGGGASPCDLLLGLRPFLLSKMLVLLMPKQFSPSFYVFACEIDFL